MEMANEELLQTLEELTKDATRHQLQTLHSILKHQAGVSYLQPYLSGHHAPIDAATFRRQVPLSCYDDYVHHINQMADGHLDSDHPLLSVDSLVCFFYSSGTSTMKPKLVPYFDSALSKAASHIAHQGSEAILRRLFPLRPNVNKILWFLYAGNAVTTRGGFKVMPASSLPLQRIGKENWFQIPFFVSPHEVVFGRNLEHQLYCHLLCALRFSDSIDGIRAAYAAGLVKAFGMLESKWEQLCDDLENGIPSLEITDAAMRESVLNVLGGPQVDLSRRIRGIFEEKNWSGIVSKLWSNIRYIKCVTTGSMKQYYLKLKYYAGEVTFLNGDYFSSECTVGINLDINQPPETTQFVMLPSAAFFEFLPFDLNEGRVVGEETVDFSGVEIGKTYEVVVTTYRGLYRYRLGDVVRVTGFHNSSPKVEFLMRAPNSANEIISEKDLMSSMENLQIVMRNIMEAEIVDFTSFSDLESSPKFLKVFLEIKEGDNFSQRVKLQEWIKELKMCAFSFENSLGGIYSVQRNRGELGPLQVSIVRPGSFDNLLEVAIKNGVPASQYKPPKIIRNREIVDVMEASTIVTVCLDSMDGLDPK